MKANVQNDYWLDVLWSLTPTVLVGLIFWLVLRSILKADQRERDAYAREERRERERRRNIAEGSGKSGPGPNR